MENLLLFFIFMGALSGFFAVALVCEKVYEVINGH